MLAVFAPSVAQANTPFNAAGLIETAPEGSYLFRADNGENYYVWTDQGKELLGPYVGKRVQIKGSYKTTPKGADFITWVVNVREL